MSENETETEQSTDQTMADRGNTRSRRPTSEAFRAFIGSNWGPRPSDPPERGGAADCLAARHQLAGAPFAGQRLVIPAGTYKVRSNDCDYRFRPHSAFAHLSGLGGEKSLTPSSSSTPLTRVTRRALPMKLSCTSSRAPHDPQRSSTLIHATANSGWERARRSLRWKQ